MLKGKVKLTALSRLGPPAKLPAGCDSLRGGHHQRGGGEGRRGEGGRHGLRLRVG